MIAIVDYRAGNLTSVAAALRKLGQPCCITSDPAAITGAERIVFPGVGAAGTAMQHLTDLDLVEPLRAAVAAGRPFLGICLGYQILFEHSEEDDCGGLGLLHGTVRRFPDSMPGADGRRLKVPHMGWNEVTFREEHALWDGLAPGSEFYFVHSYYAQPGPADVAATTVYGIEFAAGIVHDNLAAFQFHPEKSGRPGLRLLANFCGWQPG